MEAKEDPDFVVMARTDAFASEGLEGAIERGTAYRDAGADWLFPEALMELDQYRHFKEAVGIPVLANMTEFGKTPIYQLDELRKAHVDIVLYPLSVNRTMNQAALKVLETIRREGSQENCLEMMQNRTDLYQFLNYHQYEQKLKKGE